MLSQDKKKALYRAGQGLLRLHCFSAWAKNKCCRGLVNEAQTTLQCSAAPGSLSHSWNASSVLLCACWGLQKRFICFFEKKLATFVFSSGQKSPFPLQHTHASQSSRRLAKDEKFAFHSSAWKSKTHCDCFFTWFYSTEETGRTPVYTLERVVLPTRSF